MQEALEYLKKKFDLNLDQRRMPIEIPDVGRDDLVGWVGELGFKTGVEVGVEYGLFSETICKMNPQMKLYAVDPWKIYEGYRGYKKKDRVERVYKYAKRRLDKLGNCEIIREFSNLVAPRFEDESLDFIYIDGNHELPYLTQDLVSWVRKIRIGGIVAGHDYGKPKRFRSKIHTYYVVNMYAQAYNIRPWFILGQRHASPGDIRDKSLSWMWVKTHNFC
jgi:hypothetical protein